MYFSCAYVLVGFSAQQTPIIKESTFKEKVSDPRGVQKLYCNKKSLSYASVHGVRRLVVNMYFVLTHTC